MDIVEIISFNSFTMHDIEKLKKQFKDEIIELKGFSIYDFKLLRYINTNGDIEYIAQRYVLKIKTNISNISFCDSRVYFKGMPFYIA